MNRFEIDDREVIVALENLDNKKMNKAYRDALKKSVNPIYKQTKVNLRKSGIKNVSKKYIAKKTGREFPSMMSGIKTSVKVDGSGDEWAKVHIMKEFRLKWFEKGTAIRKTSKGKDRGSIKPHWFFKQAVDQRGKECENTLQDNIKESIKRVWDKR